MKVIYEPSGQAREYAELACNLFVTCPAMCEYCWAPLVLRKDRKEYYGKARARKDIFPKLLSDLHEMRDCGDRREVLFSFVGDPYGDPYGTLISAVLGEVERCRINATVLTKFGFRARYDFGLMDRSGIRFGQTICMMNDMVRTWWEPFASPIVERVQALKLAKEAGVRTWVSLEPVVHPEEAIQVVKELHEWVDEWRVGKLNYQESRINWVEFAWEMKETLDGLGAKYRFKEDLEKYLKGD